MKKIVVACAVGCFMLMACGGKEKKTVEAPVAPDSVVAPVSTTAQPEEQELEIDMTPATVDLAAMELHGPVKMMILECDRGNYKEHYRALFDRKGKLISYNDIEDSYQINRPEDGQTIYLYTTGSTSPSYHVDKKNMRLKSIEGGEGDYMMSHAYHYNDEGELIEIEKREEVGDMDHRDQSKERAKVTVVSRDKYGNWTSRKEGEETWTRQITYYGNEDPSTDAESMKALLFDPTKYGYRFIGKIGGDEGCEFTLSPSEGGEYWVSNGMRKLRIESYDKKSGRLVVEALHAETKKRLGAFDGTLDASSPKLRYKGVFTNVSGGKVGFDLETRNGEE